MTSGAALAPAERAEERKRLGQFFTGEPLARLLAALADAGRAGTILDPMAGSGDMLVAARQVGADNARLTAIEIDPLAASRCAERLHREGRLSSQTVLGNAFAPETWSQVAGEAWDLVITNPPYVRYQRTARPGNGRVSLPSAAEIRRGLIAILEKRTASTAEDRSLFPTLAARYSGLADLAVPAWLLCASLVAPKGRLAMVVPGTWLSRDYALPVLYLLRRCFEMECVVEDGHAAWFGDALVRTTLVVARRVTCRRTGLTATSSGYIHVRLDASAMDSRSVVGGVQPDSDSPELDFARQVRRLRRPDRSFEAPGTVVRRVKDGHFRDLIASHGPRASWILALEPNQRKRVSPGPSSASAAHVPQQIREALEGAAIDVRTLADYGWRVGQGLRTGCNLFFYAERIRETEAATLLAVAPALGTGPIWVPTEMVRTVVRKQRDLAARNVVEDSPGRVLVLGAHALREDIEAAEGVVGSCPYEPIPEPLGGHVRRAAEAEVRAASEPRRVPDLSAVITNVRLADASRPDRPPRFWYQLPPLARRHIPDLFIPRVNHGYPMARSNRAGAVIDANFSTLWRERDDALPVDAMLAVLRSTWVRATLEASATVLGGGALKLEATHLRRLALPLVGGADAAHLADLGSLLGTRDRRQGASLARKIDEILWRNLLREPIHRQRYNGSIRQLATELERRRNPEPRRP